jgi:2-methylfumaryl-CoA isomerase
VGRLSAAAAGLPVEDRAGNDLQGGYGQAFRTSDNRWVMVVGLTDRQWKALIGAIDPESKVRTALAAAEADVTTAIGRYLNRQLVTALIQPWFNSRSLEDVQGVLDGAKASWSVHRTFSEVLEDPRVDPALNDLWSEVDHPTLGRMRMPGSPIRRGGRVIAPAAASPLPGQDSEDVLVSVLGLSSTEVATLIDEGVVL